MFIDLCKKYSANLKHSLCNIIISQLLALVGNDKPHLYSSFLFSLSSVGESSFVCVHCHTTEDGGVLSKVKLFNFVSPILHGHFTSKDSHDTQNTGS